jgi:hypothetical protein
MHRRFLPRPQDTKVGVQRDSDSLSVGANMSDENVLGFVASGLVLTTFWMRDMLLLRLVAIASNVAFISYGHVAHVVPVLLLHICLLPINLWHVLPLLQSTYSAWLDRNTNLTRAPRMAQGK